MPIRPHSISELAQFAKDDSLPSSKGIKNWLRVADTLRKQAQQANKDGDHQAAYLFLIRSVTYILVKIPDHPSYHKLNPTQMSNLKNNGLDILYSLEQLKPRVADRYEQWVARDPRHAEIPSQLQGTYGAAISPVVVPRAERQDSGREVARPVVSSDSGHSRLTVPKASTKLSGALEEYLRDPNSEQNRIEYKTNKALADGKIANKAKPQSASSTPKKEEPAPATSTAESSSAAAKKRPASIQPTIDLLGSIEESQPTMFNPHTNSPSLSWFQQQPANPAYNPFRQSTVLPQMTGMPTQPFVAAQPTGFGMPSASPFAQAQVTGMPFQQTGSPFHQQPFGAQAAGAPSMPFQTGIMQPQPQATGSNNPFRQSMAFPQMNGMPNQPGTEGVQPRSASTVAFLPPLPQNNMNSGQPGTQSPFAAALINQPASTPITGGNSNQNLKPVVSHQIGSRNPFGQPKAPSPPPLPKPATLGELAFGAFGGHSLQATPTGMPSNSGFNPQSVIPSAATQQQFSTRLAGALGDSGRSANANMSSSFVSQPTGAKPFSADSQISTHNNIRQSTSINDLSRDMDGIRLGASPETPRPRSDTLKMMEEAERRQWQEQEIARRQKEDAALLAQEEAARRQRRRTQVQKPRITKAGLDATIQATVAESRQLQLSTATISDLFVDRKASCN